MSKLLGPKRGYVGVVENLGDVVYEAMQRKGVARVRDIPATWGDKEDSGGWLTSCFSRIKVYDAVTIRIDRAKKLSKFCDRDITVETHPTATPTRVKQTRKNVSIEFLNENGSIVAQLVYVDGKESDIIELYRGDGTRQFEYNQILVSAKQWAERLGIECEDLTIGPPRNKRGDRSTIIYGNECSV